MPPYIGSRISLISRSDVRYVGTLYTIDPQESTIALQNVRNMGTENRRPGAEMVEGSSTVYEYIIFRGDNIKNIKLSDDDSDNVLINDPAILEVKQSGYFVQNQPTSPYKKQGFKKAKANNAASWKGNRGGFNRYGERRGPKYHRRGDNRSRRSRGGTRNGRGNQFMSYGGYNQTYTNNHGYHGKEWIDAPDYKRRYSGNRGRSISKNKRSRNWNRKSRNRNRDYNPDRHIPGTGKFLDRRTKDDKNPDLKITDNEFDFQGNLARFDMSSLRDGLIKENQDKNSDDTKEPKSEFLSNDAEYKEHDETSKDQEIKGAYKKDMFFDILTTSKDVRKETGPEIRELNAETFGKIGSIYRCRSRWFRKWRGRGSRRNVGGGYNK